MVAIYITSPENGSGKTAVCAGLGKYLLGKNKRVGFLKPVIADKTENTEIDAASIKHLLTLEEPIDLLCPDCNVESTLRDMIKEAYEKVSPGKKVIIIEGTSSQSQASRQIVEVLDAMVIIVESYSQEVLKAINSYQDFGEHLLGVVLNKVPGNRLEQVRDETFAQSDKTGINILGVLPEDRALFTLTVGELAEQIQGEILSGAGKTAELVNNFMLGAMCIDPGPVYFGNKTNKAAIIRSGRPDMQLAALETSTTCLVLTGTEEPVPVVRQLAERKNIPIILTRDEPTTVVTSIEDALGKARFNQEKLPRLTEVMDQHFDFKTAYKGLGLAD